MALKRSLLISEKNSDIQGICLQTSYLAEAAFLQGSLDEANLLTQASLNSVRQYQFDRDIVRLSLLLGRLALSQCEFKDANDYLHAAVTRAREANIVEFELPGIVAMAELRVTSALRKCAFSR